MQISCADENIIAETKTWLEQAVIGLNLCPFAKAVHVKRQIRYVVSDAATPNALCEVLTDELKFLVDADAETIDTTLIIHPHTLSDFLDYNDFLDVANKVLEVLKLEGEIQIASFHPHYQFADAAPDDITNYTNRSPYPMLHLLRESSVGKAVAAFPDAAMIYEKNIVTMQKLGLAGWEKLFSGPIDIGIDVDTDTDTGTDTDIARVR